MSDIANKVETLMEAMPYLQKYQGKIIVIKYGGSAMEDPALRAEVMADIILLKIMEENGEELFGSIDDDDELDKVYDYYMQEVFADEDEDETADAEE